MYAYEFAIELRKKLDDEMSKNSDLNGFVQFLNEQQWFMGSLDDHLAVHVGEKVKDKTGLFVAPYKEKVGFRFEIMDEKDAETLRKLIHDPQNALPYRTYGILTDGYGDIIVYNGHEELFVIKHGRTLKPENIVLTETYVEIPAKEVETHLPLLRRIANEYNLTKAITKETEKEPKDAEKIAVKVPA